MAELNASTPAVASPAVVEEMKSGGEAPVRMTVDSSAKLEDVLNLDVEGVELYFESDKGRFFEMSEDAIRALHHDNRIRYHVAAEANARHDPEMDGFSARFSVGENRDTRAKTQAAYRAIPQSADALATLTAYAGKGKKGRWVRPDKIEYWKRKGLEFVAAGSDGNPTDPSAFVQAPVHEGHFATRVKSGVDELVYMCESVENNLKRKAVVQEAADRQAATLTARTPGIADYADREGGPAFRDITPGV